MVFGHNIFTFANLFLNKKIYLLISKYGNDCTNIHFFLILGRILSRLLTHTHLPGLSSLDQMHLLALADTVSTCNTDLAERFAIDAATSAMAKESLVGQSDEVITDSLDDCGLRFLLAMKHYGYLLRSEFKHL